MIKIKKALIPAAGKGIRAFGKTCFINKVMWNIKGIPILAKNILLLRECMAIRDITIIVGYDDLRIKNYFGNGDPFKVDISYIKCPAPDQGLAEGIYLAKDFFQEPFVCLLGDELYLNSNHNDCPALEDAFAICAVQKTTDLKKIARNYAVRIENGLVKKMIEKPSIEKIDGPLMGCGTWVLRPEIFDWIQKATPSPRTGKKEFVEILDNAIQAGQRVAPFFCQGEYFNVNTVEVYNDAQYCARSKDFDQNKISVIIPAYNEEASIRYVVEDFLPLADEVLVIDNQSTDKTSDIAKASGAKVLQARLKGYGDTIRYGLAHATGDIFVIVEADHTFRAKDLGKFLEYLKDADMVVGTRTTCELIEEGANMRGLLRLGNLVAAKLIEALWWSQKPRFTDVGCTYRAIWREAYQKIRPHLRGIGPEFSPEMMIKILHERLRVIEIPVTYHPRIGDKSKLSKNWLQILNTALKMLRMIIRERLHPVGRVKLREKIE